MAISNVPTSGTFQFLFIYEGCTNRPLIDPAEGTYQLRPGKTRLKKLVLLEPIAAAGTVTRNPTGQRASKAHNGGVWDVASRDLRLLDTGIYLQDKSLPESELLSSSSSDYR